MLNKGFLPWLILGAHILLLPMMGAPLMPDAWQTRQLAFTSGSPGWVEDGTCPAGVLPSTDEPGLSEQADKPRQITAAITHFLFNIGPPGSEILIS